MLYAQSGCPALRALRAAFRVSRFTLSRFRLYVFPSKKSAGALPRRFPRSSLTELEIHIQAQLIATTQTFLTSDDTLPICSGHDRGFFVEHVGDVERRSPGRAALHVTLVGNGGVERRHRRDPVVVDVAPFHPVDVVHHAVVVVGLQHEAPGAEVVAAGEDAGILRTGLAPRIVHNGTGRGGGGVFPAKLRTYRARL